MTRIVQPKGHCPKCLGLGRTAKAVLSALLVLQMLVLLALAASPTLHHDLHPDSNQPGHHCLVTALASGQVSGPEMMPVLVLAVVFVICAVLPPVSLPPRLFKYRFAPSRAPPRF